MWAACAALLAALACIGVSARHYRSLMALEDGVVFSDRVGRGSVRRLQSLRTTVVGGYALELLNSALDSADLRDAVFGLNEVGSELRFLLRGAHELPRSSARIALALGGGLAVLQIIAWLQGSEDALGFGLACLAFGLTAGLVCAALASKSASHARLQLAAWGRVIRVLGEAAEARFATIATPESRSRQMAAPHTDA